MLNNYIYYEISVLSILADFLLTLYVITVSCDGKGLVLINSCIKKITYNRFICRTYRGIKMYVIEITVTQRELMGRLKVIGWFHEAKYEWT